MWPRQLLSVSLSEHGVRLGFGLELAQLSGAFDWRVALHNR